MDDTKFVFNDEFYEHAKEIEEIKKPYLEAFEKYKSLHLKELYDKTLARLNEVHSDYVCGHPVLLIDHKSYQMIRENDLHLEKPDFY